MGRTTRSAVSKVAKEQAGVTMAIPKQVGPATSTPAVKATKRKRPIMPSPGLSPLKMCQDLEDTVEDLSKDRTDTQSAAVSPDLGEKSVPAVSITYTAHSTSINETSLSLDTSQDSTCSKDFELSSEPRPAPKRKRRKREHSINHAVEKLKADVKEHFEEIDNFSLEFV